jgi:exopolysaccharide biosynthesis polyprenyl glycosylphosphotransferase
MVDVVLPRQYDVREGHWTGRELSATPAKLGVPAAEPPPLAPRVETVLVVAADAVAFGLLAASAGSVLPGLTLPFLVVTMVAAAVTWRLKSLYARRVSMSVLDDLPALGTGVLVGLAPATALSVLFGDERNFERRVLIAGIGLLAATFVCRWVAYTVVLALRRSGRIHYPTVMIGCGSVADALARRIEDHPESGLRLIGVLCSSSRDCNDGRVPYLGNSKDLAHVVRRHHVTNLVIGYGGMMSSDLVGVLRTADAADLEVHVVPRLFELATLHGSDDHIWGLPLARLRSPADRRLTRPVKRVTDVILAFVALVLTSPLLLAVALAVRVELGRVILFRQARIGAYGETFQLLKFRSMRPSVAADGQRWTVAEQEIGPVGRFIRRYSLDELPQLWNVLRGDMSLVGPRPERPEYVEQFVAAFPRYVHRHRVPVGMTGLAAVNGLRGDTSIEERANFDNWYIENWSLWLDVKILLRTVSAVLRGTGR